MESKNDSNPVNSYIERIAKLKHIYKCKSNGYFNHNSISENDIIWSRHYYESELILLGKEIKEGNINYLDVIESVDKLKQSLEMILHYVEIAKNRNPLLSFGTDDDIMTFLNHSRIPINKENIYEIVSDIFNYPKEDIFFTNPIDPGYGDIVCQERVIYSYNKQIDFSKEAPSIPKIYIDNIKIDAKNLSNYSFPKIACNSIFLDNATDISNVVFPSVVLNGLYMNNVKSANNTICPKIVIGGFLADNIENGENISWPLYVESYFNIGYYKDDNNLDLSKCVVDGDLIIGVKSSKNMKLPPYVNGTVSMSDLEEVSNLKLPNYAKLVELDSLKNPDGLIIPQPLTYKIIGNGFIISPSDINLEENKRLTYI